MVRAVSFLNVKPQSFQCILLELENVFHTKFFIFISFIHCAFFFFLSELVLWPASDITKNNLHFSPHIKQLLNTTMDFAPFVKFQRNLQLTSDLTCIINRHRPSSEACRAWPIWQDWAVALFLAKQSFRGAKNKSIGRNCPYIRLKKWWVYEISQWVESHS